MKLEADKRFQKDFEALPKYVQKSVVKVIDEIERAATLFDVRHCAKLQGYKDLYRIRTGDYRITLSLLVYGDTVILLRVLPRSQIYKNL